MQQSKEAISYMQLGFLSPFWLESIELVQVGHLGLQYLSSQTHYSLQIFKSTRHKTIIIVPVNRIFMGQFLRLLWLAIIGATSYSSKSCLSVK